MVTTSHARPTRFIAPISICDGSISYHFRPCAAERGKAWWLWCQDSPKEGMASQKTLVDLSSMSKRREPKKWQIELTDQVTWCCRKMRTKPPQIRPVSAPFSDQLSRPPSTAGIASEASAISGNFLL